MCEFVRVIVSYYCVCMCEWYRVHVYMKVHAQQVVFYRMLVISVSYVATLLSGRILYLFLYVKVIITKEQKSSLHMEGNK